MSGTVASTARTSEAAQDPTDRVIERVQSVYKSWNRATSPAQMRRDWDALFDLEPAGFCVEPVCAGGLRGEWVRAEAADASTAVLYLHGGGFQIGSPRSHRELMFWLSSASGCSVFGLDYRLAPEHRFPAPLNDAIAAYEWLLRLGFSPRTLGFAGDSAGGGLAVSTLLALRAAGHPLPSSAVLMSAWTDLTASGSSYETLASADPINRTAMIRSLARGYVGHEGSAANPLVSPLFGDLHGLPPLLIQVGSREIVLSDSESLAEKARAAGVEVRLQVWVGMIHVFQQFPRDLVEARKALKAAGDFLRSHMQRRLLSQGP